MIRFYWKSPGIDRRVLQINGCADIQKQAEKYTRAYQAKEEQTWHRHSASTSKGSPKETDTVCLRAVSRRDDGSAASPTVLTVVAENEIDGRNRRLAAGLTVEDIRDF